MPHIKPFHRTYRDFHGFISGAGRNNIGYSSWAYIADKEYAENPQHYVRAYMILQEDLENLFQYIEPSDECLSAFSFRIHELLMRACTELEANFKAILKENIYTGSQFNMPIYKRINTTHHLSSYEAKLPIWNGGGRIMRPFANWEKDGSLPWYKAYNDSKHDRRDGFRLANFEHLMNAVTGLLIVLTSQFGYQDFSAGATTIVTEGSAFYDFEAAIGSLFRIKYPDDWSDFEKYDFDWQKLCIEPVRFLKIDYDKIP